MTELFELGDLPSVLQIPEVDTESATRARRRASGWLKHATGLADWPNPVPDDLWAWGVELGAIAFRNPAAAISESIDDYNVSYDRERRAEILKDATTAYATAGSPQFSFPEPDWHWTALPILPPTTL